MSMIMKLMITMVIMMSMTIVMIMVIMIMMMIRKCMFKSLYTYKRMDFKCCFMIVN